MSTIFSHVRMFLFVTFLKNLQDSRREQLIHLIFIDFFANKLFFLDNVLVGKPLIRCKTENYIFI